jgi:TonB family protein
MFNNLIESSSHSRELKRRGSFILFTTASYALLFAIAGVASIYAYDAQLGERDLELVSMTAPVEIPAPDSPHATPEQSRNTNRPTTTVDERTIAMLSVNHPEITPETISAPNPNIPIRDRVPFIISDRNRNADSGGPIGRGSDAVVSITTPTPTVVEVSTLPPPVPQRKTVISKGVITSEALSLPHPPYPQMAKLMHLQGRVSVQVLIDETGKVISAQAIDGHPVFRQVSETAAYQARFSPTKLGDQPVKVSGVITYNFVLQ